MGSSFDLDLKMPETVGTYESTEILVKATLNIQPQRE